MAEDKVKVGTGLLALVVGGFYAILSARRISVTAAKRISDRRLDTNRIPVENIKVQDTQESAHSTDSLEAELALLLQRATEGERLYRKQAQRLAERSVVLATVVITLSVLAATASLFAAVK